MNINTDSSLNIKNSDEFSSTLTGFLGLFLIHRLACRIRGAEGADSNRRPPLRPARGLFSLESRHAPGASGLAGVREGEGEGEGRRREGEAPTGGTKRDPLRS